MTPDFELRFVGIVYGADFVILEFFHEHLSHGI